MATPRETLKARGLPLPGGRNVSLAAITVAWCAGHPGKEFPSTLPYMQAATDLRRLFPYSWGSLMAHAEREKTTETPRTYAQAGDAVRALMIAAGHWTAADFTQEPQA